MVSTLVAGIPVGYLINERAGNGDLNAAVMGFLGDLVESVIILIAGAAPAGIAGLD